MAFVSLVKAPPSHLILWLKGGKKTKNHRGPVRDPERFKNRLKDKVEGFKPAEGNRNLDLFRSAADLGSARSLFDESEFQSLSETLKDRAAEAGLPADEVDSSLKSGLSAGEARPVEVAQLDTIVLSSDEARVVNEAIASLARNESVFSRGGVLVDVLPAGEDEYRDPLQPVIAPLPRTVLRPMLTQTARFVHLDGGIETEKHPPDYLTPAIIDRRHWPGIREIRHVLPAPALAPDGSVIHRQGYCAKWKTFFPSRRFETFDVPANPSREDALKAKQQLFEIVREFPFSRGSFSAWLCLVMTLSARVAGVFPCPLFLIDASVRGSGKTLLWKLAYAIATGLILAVRALPREDDEVRKALTSHLLAGDVAILFDNAKGTLGGTSLEAACTAETWTDRFLGASRSVTVPVGTVLGATSNNALITPDIVRRAIVVRLESTEERPEERKVSIPDVLGHVLERFPQDLKAVLTIFRAWHAAGCPQTAAPAMGSFTAWSRNIRMPVLWLGEPDPLLTRGEIRDSADTETAALGRFLKALRAADPEDKGLTAREILSACDQHPALKEALEELVARPELNSRNVGNKLRACRRRAVQGLLLDPWLDRDDSQHWRVAIADQGTGESAGSAGSAGSGSYACEEESEGDAVTARGDAQTGRDDTPQSPQTPQPITSPSQAEEVSRHFLNRSLPLAFDTETTGLDPLVSKIRLLQVSDGNETVVFDVFKTGHEPLRQLLEDAPGIWFNAKFDLSFLESLGIRPKRFEDAMLAHNAASNETKSLKVLADEVLGIRLEKEAQKSDWSGELSGDQLRYAARDAETTLRLWQALESRLTPFRKVYKQMRDAVPAVLQMERAGMPFAREKHASMVSGWKAQLEETRAKLTACAPGLDPGSTKQIGQWIERNLPAPVVKSWGRTESGQLQTDHETLARFSGQHPALGALLALRKVEKLVSTYGDSWSRVFHPGTNRIHSNYRIAGAKTGRMTCSAPNLQQAPHDPEFRSLFRADEGWKVISADFGQQELRIAACLAKEAAMLQAFETGRDLHRLTASLVFGKAPEAVSKEERSVGKTLNFGTLYGAGPGTVKEKIRQATGRDLSIDETKAVLARFFAGYPALKKWQEGQINRGRDTLTVSSKTGRVLKFFKSTWSPTESLNFPIQSSGAEVLYATLTQLPAVLAETDSELVACVHDELVLHAPEPCAAEAARRVKEAMTEAFLSIFPEVPRTGLVDAGMGDSWGEAK